MLEHTFGYYGGMATRAALRAIEDDIPWLREDFQADLAALGESVAEQARRFAADMVVLARLAAQVPRCPMDERGPSPWTSFRREVAVARKLSDQGAAAEIRAAQALTRCLPRTLALLSEGRTTVQRARAFLTELEGVEDDVARLVDEQLADKVAGLPPWRIKQVTRAAVMTADPDEAARATGEANDARDVELHPEPNDQASVVISGPAVPLTRWWATLDGRARALKAAGDPRALAQLRFDLAVADYPCQLHAPDDPTADPTADPRSAAAAAGLRPSFIEPASSDCRMSRPVQANVTVPVETSLGLSNEPGWLDGYGWISAPTCRLLLVDAELRRICVHADTGHIVDVADSDVRPPPTFTGLRHALVDMVTDDITLSRAAGRVEEQHDPTPPHRCASSSSCATASTTAPPAPGSEPRPASSTTTRPGRSARPRPGTSSRAQPALTSSSTTAGRRCARRPPPSGSPPQARSSRSHATCSRPRGSTAERTCSCPTPTRSPRPTWRSSNPAPTRTAAPG